MRVTNVEEEDFQAELMYLLMEEDIISKPDRAEIRKWASIKKPNQTNKTPETNSHDCV